MYEHVKFAFFVIAMANKELFRQKIKNLFYYNERIDKSECRYCKIDHFELEDDENNNEEGRAAWSKQ